MKTKAFKLASLLFLFSFESLVSQTHKAPVADIQFSNDGKTLMSFANDGEGTKYWDLATGNFIKAVKETNKIQLPDGKRYITKTVENKELIIKVFESETNKELHTIFYDNGKILKSNFAVSPDGKYIVCHGSDFYLLTFSVETGELIKKWGLTYSVNGVDFHPNSKEFYLVQEDVTIFSYDLATFEIESFKLKEKEGYRLSSFKANYTVYIATFVARKMGYENEFVVYADKGKSVISENYVSLISIVDVILHPKRDEIVIAFTSQTVHIVNIKTNQSTILTIKNPLDNKLKNVTDKKIKGSINSVKISADGTKLAVGTGNAFVDKEDFWVYLFDLETGKRIYELKQK